jgi:hypothetical protein
MRERTAAAGSTSSSSTMTPSMSPKSRTSSMITHVSSYEFLPYKQPFRISFSKPSLLIPGTVNHIGLSQKHLFLANEREIKIISFRSASKSNEVKEIEPKPGQFSTHTLGENNKLHGFFEN